MARLLWRPARHELWHDESIGFRRGRPASSRRGSLLADAIAAFRSRYTDPRHVNDDTPLIRSLAERERITFRPASPATTGRGRRFTALLGHSFHRGIVFVDGHGRVESRFFSGRRGLLSDQRARRESQCAARAPQCGRRSRRPSPRPRAACTPPSGRSRVRSRLLAPVYAAAHGAGMWRGLGLSARRLRRRCASTSAATSARAPSRPAGRRGRDAREETRESSRERVRRRLDGRPPRRAPSRPGPERRNRCSESRRRPPR